MPGLNKPGDSAGLAPSASVSAQVGAGASLALRNRLALRRLVADDAYPHLLGHQITPADSPVYHIFLIGGFDWGVSEIYYTDSATSVWSTVHAFNWLDAYTTLVILGGRGYLW